MINLITKVFVKKIELYQYSAALAIAGAIKGTSQTEIFKLESSKFRRYFRRLCTFIKIKQSAKSSYLYNLIPKSNQSYNTRQFDKVDRFYCRTDIFKKFFFPSIIDEWNKFKPEIRTIDSFLNFRKLILNLDNGRPLFNPIYNIFNPIGLKYFTRFRLELSHLKWKQVEAEFTRRYKLPVYLQSETSF